MCINCLQRGKLACIRGCLFSEALVVFGKEGIATSESRKGLGGGIETALRFELLGAQCTTSTFSINSYNIILIYVLCLENSPCRSA